MSENPDSGFKVVDRRPFSVDGSRRAEVQPERDDAKPSSKVASPKSSARPVAQPETERAELFEQEQTGFEMLVSYLSTTAMFQLGLLPGPGGERIAADLVNAHRTIDLLDVLQQKTQGNLTADESRLLDDVLYELRMSYVEVEKRRAPKRK
jgi:hypothetical protein